MLCARSALFGDEAGVFLTLALIGIAIVVLVLRHLAARRRRLALSDLALQEGFEFIPRPGSVHERYEAFEPFDDGHSRESSNLLRQRLGRTHWEMFDFKYVTGSGKSRRTHHWGIVVATVDLQFPQLTIRPEGLMDRLAGVLGIDDIDFESDEFSRRYHVTSSDRKMAYGIIDPRMMEFLMLQPDANWQLLGSYVMLAQPRLYEPREIVDKMFAIRDFLDLVPEFVRQDLASGG
jgi:hypothetical protein